MREARQAGIRKANKKRRLKLANMRKAKPRYRKAKGQKYRNSNNNPNYLLNRPKYEEINWFDRRQNY